MSNELQRFTYERKKPGDPIRSRDWNAAMQAITDLGNALRSNPNGIPTGPLSVQGFLNVQGTVSATRFVGDGSGLTGIQSSGGSQWSNGTNGAIHYTGGNVGIGTPYANEKLEVQGTVKATRFVG
nr:hypothetical protein [Caldilineaceae bacterium]